jgi:hypothetical protein
MNGTVATGLASTRLGLLPPLHCRSGLRYLGCQGASLHHGPSTAIAFPVVVASPTAFALPVTIRPRAGVVLRTDLIGASLIHLVRSAAGALLALLVPVIVVEVGPVVEDLRVVIVGLVGGVAQHVLRELPAVLRIAEFARERERVVYNKGQQGITSRDNREAY